MSRRSQLEHEVSVAQERIKKELELNNMVDDEEDTMRINQ